MLSAGEMNKLLEQIILQAGKGFDFFKEGALLNEKDGTREKDKNKIELPKLTPEKLLVILGLLSGSLEVDSVLVDRRQVINVLLSGSLKRKTKLDKMLDEIGKMPFDHVLRSLLERVNGL